jgi:hypothetical protein
MIAKVNDFHACGSEYNEIIGSFDISASACLWDPFGNDKKGEIRHNHPEVTKRGRCFLQNDHYTVALHGQRRREKYEQKGVCVC